ncbi:MAG: IS4 family transposase [Lachnospiraceae bacterium]|nr:IS4 family transposase [Lachnospiraceae bacterium]
MNKCDDLDKQYVLNTIISEMSSMPSLFSVASDTNFTRNRIFAFKETLTTILGMAGGSLNKEIYDHFKTNKIIPTASAFVQARAKVLPEAFQFLFHEFNNNCSDNKLYKGYRLLAVDGTDLNIPKNPNDKETYLNQGFNQLHINALYDVENHTYTDALIQGRCVTNEISAVSTMIRRNRFSKPTILIADRGYECFNLFELCNRINNLNYLIRVKNGGIREVSELPMRELDRDMAIEIRTTQTKADKIAYANRTAHFLSGKSKFGKYKKSQTWDFESKSIVRFRVVRFKITEDTYETIVTSLNRFEFPLSEIKNLYHKRWGIETSFRELKYALGLVNLHSKKRQFIEQEIWARLTMYNYAERIIQRVIVRQDKSRKWAYQVNFTMGFTICLDYFRHPNINSPPNLENLISQYILPIRPDRADKRKLKPKSVVGFLYRVA